jgi:hypothetical protein
MDKSKNDKYILNPKTGRHVLKSGKAGQSILMIQKMDKEVEESRKGGPRILKIQKMDNYVGNNMKSKSKIITNFVRMEDGFRFPIFNKSYGIVHNRYIFGNLENLFDTVCHINRDEKDYIYIVRADFYIKNKQLENISQKEIMNLVKRKCTGTFCGNHKDTQFDEIQNCKKRFVLLGFGGWLDFDEGHQGTLLIDKNEKSVSVLDPHGSGGDEFILPFTQIFDDYGKWVAKKLNYNFFDINSSCSKEGIQYLENNFKDIDINDKTLYKPVRQMVKFLDSKTKNTRKSNCILWSYFMIIAKLSNPDMSMKQTQESLENYLNEKDFYNIAKAFNALVDGL